MVTSSVTSEDLKSLAAALESLKKNFSHCYYEVYYILSSEGAVRTVEPAITRAPSDYSFHNFLGSVGHEFIGVPWSRDEQHYIGLFA